MNSAAAGLPPPEATKAAGSASSRPLSLSSYCPTGLAVRCVGRVHLTLEVAERGGNALPTGRRLLNRDRDVGVRLIEHRTRRLRRVVAVAAAVMNACVFAGPIPDTVRHSAFGPFWEGSAGMTPPVFSPIAWPADENRYFRNARASLLVVAFGTRHQPTLRRRSGRRLAARSRDRRHRDRVVLEHAAELVGLLEHRAGSRDLDGRRGLAGFEGGRLAAVLALRVDCACGTAGPWLIS